MDAIFLIGETDPKLRALLEKLGYDVQSPPAGESVPTFAASRVFDVILVDGRADSAAEAPYLELLEYFATDDVTRKVPILYIAATPAQEHAAESARIQGLEIVCAPLAYGSFMTKLATLLRLRKMAGASDRSATLSEANTALRDLNRRYAREMEEARKIQESLLPRKLPSDARFELAVAYQPLEEVGGDWYFAQQYPDERVCLLIADVTGHGLSAALIGSMTKLAIAAAGIGLPHLQLHEVNRLMAPQLPDGRFVTMGSFLYEPANGTLHHARAGHPPALLLHRKSGTVEELKGRGFAVGFTDDAEYSAERATLEPDDLLLVVTDGILEAQNRDRELYGADRLRAALQAIPEGASATAAMERILIDFETFIDGRILKDDVTTVLLRRVS